MAEWVDAADLKSAGVITVGVRVSSPGPGKLGYRDLYPNFFKLYYIF